MSSDTSIRALDDVASIRALAHPTRLDILDLLREHSTLTATECANLLALTPKTCSYHLQTLAKHGFVAEVPAPGRERPWRRIHEETTLHPHRPEEPRLRSARDELLQIRIERDRARLREAMVAVSSSPPDWAGAVTIHGRLAMMTASELQAWGEEVESVTRRYTRAAGQATDDPERRPVHLILYGFPQAQS